jgi:hypothetical protein
MITREWMAQSQDWLTTDHHLLTAPDGWSPRAPRGAFAIQRRAVPDDPNHLFRWRIDRLGAPAEAVFEAFVDRILENHGHWTREYTGGRVVDVLGPDARILYQQFDPGVPGVARRDLCYLAVTRRLPDGAIQASYRSVDAVPAVPGFTRIRWWGANLCVPGRGGTSAMIYLDRENQGGAFPPWLMNLLMPRYLRAQCEALVRFFEGGGPARTPAVPLTA